MGASFVSGLCSALLRINSNIVRPQSPDSARAQRLGSAMSSSDFAVRARRGMHVEVTAAQPLAQQNAF